MHAAVVTSYGEAPRYQEFPDPQPAPEQIVVDVLASAIHPRVRSQAAGSHYTSSDELPLIPGVDGVGRDAEGNLRYFVLHDTTRGAMAERVAIDPRRSIVLPETADPALIAAAMNPAMSSWVALRRRAGIAPGARVLMLGATGSAGRLTVQIARHLDASFVAGAGRDPGRLAQLPELGADLVIDLAATDGSPARLLAEAGSDADIVLDYLWGEPTAAALRAIIPARTDDDRLLTWVEIGSVAGPESPIPSAALRASTLRIIGSGQGSVPASDIVAELPGLVEEITGGGYDLPVRTVPLSRVATAWADSLDSPDRFVLVP